jgi:hypothetical protein
VLTRSRRFGGFCADSPASPEHLAQRRDQPQPHEVVGIGLDIGEHIGEHLSPRVQPADQRGTLGLGELEHREELAAGWLAKELEGLGLAVPAGGRTPPVRGTTRTPIERRDVLGGLIHVYRWAA